MKNNDIDLKKLPIYNFSINNNQKIIIDKKGIYNFNYCKNNNYNIEILVLENIKAIINQFFNSQINLKISLKENSYVDYYSYTYKKLSKNIEINQTENSFLKTYIVEFAKETKSNYNIDLIGINSEINFNLAIYADNKAKQNHQIVVNHLCPNSKSNIINHGILTSDADCKLNVKSFIAEGCFKTEAYQKSKFLTFSDYTNVTINPILLINDYDVIASHSASVSKVSDLDKYYLQSRGLSELDIQKIITIGHLLETSPPSIKNELEEILKRRIKNGKISS